MASKFKDMKDKRDVLVRNTARAVGYLQMIMDDAGTPEHLKPRLLACLELVDRGLLGQPMEDEKVVVEVTDGIARVASKTEYVEVVIHDRDTEFEV